MNWYLLSLVPLITGAFCFENNFVQRLKNWENKLKLLFPFGKESDRRTLELALSRALLSPNSGTRGQAQYLPQYKFYTALYEDLVSQRKRLGISLEQSLWHLREGMVHDGKFEKKVRGELIACYWQFFLITFITWSFTTLSLFLIKQRLSFAIGLSMLLLELLGLFFFTLVFTYVKKKIFSDYADWFSRIYRLRGFLSAGTPVTLALKESRILELFHHKNKKFRPFQEALEASITRLQKEGTPILPDLKFCLDELWFTQDCDFGLFLKALSSLKLAVILIFYLGAYFLYLYSFISTFTRV